MATGQAINANTAAADPIKEKIIVSILEQFEEEVAAWLRTHGKGGEDDDDILLAMAMPACFPLNENILQHTSEQTIPYFKEHPSELLEKIESKQDEKLVFDRLRELVNGATKIDWNKVSEEDKEQAREATCRATVEADVEMLKIQLSKGISSSNESNCFLLAWERGKQVYGTYDFNIALYAGFIRYLLCETEEANCGKEGGAEAFGCGLSNGFLLEVDLVALLEAAEDISNLKPEEILQCLVEAIPFGGKREDNPDFNDVLFRCITGVEIGDLVEGVKDFVIANWNEPYYQGQATAFVVTLLSPLKAKVIEKIQKLPNYASRIGKLETLAKAKNADELVVLAKAATKGVGRFIARSGAELKGYLSKIVNKPLGKTYNGKWYRYTGNPNYNPTEIYSGMIDAENRFRKGLYLSETKAGNIIEANSYGGTSGKTLYEMSNVQIFDILDLTDESVITQLGTSFEQMKLSNVENAYEFTQEIAIWAKNNGYSGIKFYGAQGGSTSYTNFVIFDQATINTSIKGSVNIISW